MKKTIPHHQSIAHISILFIISQSDSKSYLVPRSPSLILCLQVASVYFLLLLPEQQLLPQIIKPLYPSSLSSFHLSGEGD